MLKRDTAEIFRKNYTQHINCVREIWNFVMLYLPVNWDLKNDLYDKPRV
jgi:hypothetical protein